MPELHGHEPKKQPKHHVPPHVEDEIKHLREKVARLEGKVDVILNIIGKQNK